MSVHVPMVLGAGGMLGRAVARLFEERYAATVSATRFEADVTDPFRLQAEVERLHPTVIVNCAAFADVDGCELDPDLARRVNAEGAGNAARAAAVAGCRIIHVSTDYVFDGARRSPYTEEDRPAPLSEYGRSKLLGEERVAAEAPDHLIVRSSWLYGAGRRNFVDAIRSRALAGAALRVVDDQVGSPTWADDLAEAVARLLDVDVRGILHFANQGSCSRHELAVAIVTEAGMTGVNVEPTTTAAAGRVAVRPACSALDTARYTRLTGHTPRPWREALRAYLHGSAEPARASDAPA